MIGCSGLSSTSTVPQSSNKKAAADRIVAASTVHSSPLPDCEQYAGSQPLDSDDDCGGGDGGDDGSDGGDDGSDGGDDGSDGGDSDDGGSDDSDDGGSDGSDDYDLTDDADDADDTDGTGIIIGATTSPNTSLLPPGSCQVNGQWYNSYGEPLSWCADCSDGSGAWIATIGTATAHSSTNIGFQYASNAPNPALPNSQNNYLINIICAFSPGFRNVPVIFTTAHGSRQRANNPWPTNINQHQLQNAIVQNFELQEFSGKAYPGMAVGTQFTFTYDGISVGYTVTWLGSIAAPGSVYISNYYPIS